MSSLFVNSIIKRKGTADVGLIGGFFRFTPGGPVYGISCNHVIADYNNCNVGDELTDENEKTIGTLINWIILESDIDNIAEFALFKPTPRITPAWIDFKPAGFADPDLNDAAEFKNAMGKVSQGKIIDLDHSVRITHGDTTYRIDNCIQIKSSVNSLFSDKGDSGGAVFSGNNLLGIILGMSKNSKKNGVSTFVVPFTGGILSVVDLKIL